MAPQTLNLPDGQRYTVNTIFGGVGFKSHELSTHSHPFPIGWTTVLHTEEELPIEGGAASRGRNEVDDEDDDDADDDGDNDDNNDGPVLRTPRTKRVRVKPFTKPTLQGDTIFLSSISSPSSTDFKPAASPTRQIAMMIWITLYWYFHQPEPSLLLETEASKLTPANGKPRGEWQIRIKRDGILRGRNLIPKLERMGLIASLDTAVGVNTDDAGESWSRMFVTRRMFWQIPARLFLFTLQPNRALSSFPGSPTTSRPGSPTRVDQHFHASHLRQTQSQSPHPTSHHRLDVDVPGSPIPSIVPSPSFPMGPGPFHSTSHLPTYYPPGPLVYTSTNGIRHPLRPKPPRMGETFYARFLPSVGQYLSFRVASNSPNPVPHLGPVGAHRSAEHARLCTMSDNDLLRSWMSSPRVKAFWGEWSPDILPAALSSPHSFPAIGMWDGVPFGYFEVYWVKEDPLGGLLGDEAVAFDRGLHIMIGEEWARGRVPLWLGGLVHWALTSDFRTMNICLEPRIDNERFVDRLQQNGFFKVKQVSFPHKQAWFVRLQREAWEGPAL